MNSTPVETAASSRSDFSNTEVILCRPTDRRLAQFHRSAGWEQLCDGPTFLVIACDADPDSCKQLSARLGVDLNSVLAFRDQPEVVTRQLH